MGTLTETSGTPTPSVHLANAIAREVGYASASEGMTPDATFGSSLPKLPSFVSIITEERDDSFVGDGLHYHIHQMLGEGSYGCVYTCSLAQSQTQPSQFAVKVINARRLAIITGSLLEAVVPRMFREVEALVALGAHPRIVTLHKSFFSFGSCKLYLVYELVQGGDLFNAMVRRRKPFTELEAARVLAQLADAVSFGHRKGIAHRDIKLENCLLDDEKNVAVKLCDYGQAAMLSFGVIPKTLATTAAYTAPDVKAAVKAQESYDALKGDAFSLGVVLFGLLCNTLPGQTRGAKYMQHPAWGKLSAGAQDILQKLLSEDVSARLSVEGICDHPWIVSMLSGPGEWQRNLSSASESSNSGTSRDALPSGHGNVQTIAILAAHEMFVAMQRERGTCMWAVARDDGHSHWLLCRKQSDERYHHAIKAMERCRGTISDGVQKDLFLKLGTGLETAYAHVTDLRAQSPTKELFDSLFQGYCMACSMIMDAIHAGLQAVTSTRPLWDSRPKMQHQLLMLASEQLGRERAYVCGLLDKPESLLQSSVARDVNEMVGARKTLLGSSGTSMLVVTAQIGILPALGLSEAPLASTELAALEAVEDNALALNGKSAPRVLEWYDLLTQLINKVHRHVALTTVELTHADSSGSSADFLCDWTDSPSSFR